MQQEDPPPPPKPRCILRKNEVSRRTGRCKSSMDRGGQGWKLSAPVQYWSTGHRLVGS